MSLSDPTPVDRERAGTLRFTAEALGGLLRLPPGLEITGWTFHHAAGYLELTLEGAPMPPRQHGLPAAVELSVHDTVDELGRPSRHLAWAHAPDERWLLSGPQEPSGDPPAPAPDPVPAAADPAPAADPMPASLGTNSAGI